MNKSFLDNSTFEKNSTIILRRILNKRLDVSAITHKDSVLIENAGLLNELNSKLSPDLLQMSYEMETFVYPGDIALFLIAASQNNLLKEAEEILDSVRHERRLMSLSDLLSALSESANMPGSWAAAMFGELNAERDSVPEQTITKSSIDLDAIKRGLM